MYEVHLDLKVPVENYFWYVVGECCSHINVLLNADSVLHIQLSSEKYLKICLCCSINLILH